MIQIAASMMCADFCNLGEEIRTLVEAGVDLFHFDVMDGHYVPNLTLGPPVIQSLRPHTDRPFDVHLMVTEPERYVDSLRAAGADEFIFHVETTRYPFRLIARIREVGMKPGIALNPATSAKCVIAILGSVETVLVMTVEPGFSGQSLIPATVEKVRQLRHLLDGINPKSVLAVDGNINVNTGRMLYEAGATRFVAGTSSVFNTTRHLYASRVRALREAFSPEERNG